MKKHLITAFLMTIATTILLGVLYPLVITVLAQVLFKDKANGQIRYRNGEAIGSRIIGQRFTSAKYFHSRPSNAGNGYDAANSGGTNLASTNQKLIDRVQADAANLQKENPSQPIPVDLITTSASGLDPDISPAPPSSDPAHRARAPTFRISTSRPGPKAYPAATAWSAGGTPGKCPGTQSGPG